MCGSASLLGKNGDGITIQLFPFLSVFCLFAAVFWSVAQFCVCCGYELSSWKNASSFGLFFMPFIGRWNTATRSISVDDRLMRCQHKNMLIPSKVDLWLSDGWFSSDLDFHTKIGLCINAAVSFLPVLIVEMVQMCVDPCLCPSTNISATVVATNQ